MTVSTARSRLLWRSKADQDKKSTGVWPPLSQPWLAAAPDLCPTTSSGVVTAHQSFRLQPALLAQVWLPEKHTSGPLRTPMPGQDDIVASRASANKAEKG